jgi:hypothetical protein
MIAVEQQYNYLQLRLHFLCQEQARYAKDKILKCWDVTHARKRANLHGSHLEHLLCLMWLDGIACFCRTVPLPLYYVI